MENLRDFLVPYDQAIRTENRPRDFDVLINFYESHRTNKWDFAGQTNHSNNTRIIPDGKYRATVSIVGKVYPDGTVDPDHVQVSQLPKVYKVKSFMEVYQSLDYCRGLFEGRIQARYLSPSQSFELNYRYQWRKLDKGTLAYLAEVFFTYVRKRSSTDPFLLPRSSHFDMVGESIIPSAEPFDRWDDKKVTGVFHLRDFEKFLGGKPNCFLIAPITENRFKQYATNFHLAWVTSMEVNAVAKKKA